MNPLHYLIIADIILVVVAIKLIFSSPSLFIKALASHLLFDFDGHIKRIGKWEKENDLSHKMNLLYAAIFAIVGISLLIYTCIF